MAKRLLAVLTLYFVLSLCASAFATSPSRFLPLPASPAPSSAQPQDAGPTAQAHAAQTVTLAADPCAASDSLDADLPDEQPVRQQQASATPVHFPCPLLCDSAPRSPPPGKRLRPPRG